LIDEEIPYSLRTARFEVFRMGINGLSTLFGEGLLDTTSLQKPKDYAQNLIALQLKFSVSISTKRAHIQIPFLAHRVQAFSKHSSASKNQWLLQT